MNIIEVTQGSQAWLDVRAQHYCASDAAAAMGVSKYKTRDELLRQLATGYTPDVNPAKQRLFDAGHAAEDAARPLVEAHLGEELYPCVATRTVEGMALLASFDGTNMDETIIWETKQYNEALAQAVANQELEPHYWAQLEHGMLVNDNAEKAWFTTTDGTKERMVGMWYQSVPERRAQVIAAWKQFDEDLANYQHTEVLPAVVAAVQPSLPAVVVRTNGAITVQSNLPAFATALQAYIKTIPAKPSTDQEFADADAACTALKKAEVALDTAEVNALASMSDVEEMRRVVADLKKLARDTRLATEKLVAARKESIRFEIRDEGIAAFAAHVATLNQTIGRQYMPVIETDFPAAIKNKRTVESLRGSVNNELARAKIAANEVAAKIQINMQYLRENAADHVALFPDTAIIVLKAADDLQALVKSRIADHKAEEAKKEAAIVHNANCTARINVIKNFLVQAQAKTTSDEVGALIEQCTATSMEGFEDRAAEAGRVKSATIGSMLVIADALFKAEQRQADVAKATAPIAEPVAAAPGPSAPAVPAMAMHGNLPVSRAQFDQTYPVKAAPAKPTTPPSLRLGQISDRLGFNLTADFIKTLGFEPAAVEKQAKLFHETDFAPICRALIQHVEAAIEEAAALPA